MTPQQMPPLGDLKQGDQVFVIPCLIERGRHGALVIRAVVAKASRVWVEIHSAEEHFPAKWRMRRDTQDEGTEYINSNASFRTPEQHRWHVARSGGRQFLREQGISIAWKSPWIGREAELADLIRRSDPAYKPKDGCLNPWHASAPARRQQTCPECPAG